jgi:hypothetical protein
MIKTHQKSERMLPPASKAVNVGRRRMSASDDCKHITIINNRKGLADRSQTGEAVAPASRDAPDQSDRFAAEELARQAPIGELGQRALPNGGAALAALPLNLQRGNAL